VILRCHLILKRLEAEFTCGKAARFHVITLEHDERRAEPRMPSKVATKTLAVKRALALVTEAMDLLDAHVGPPDAAAHLELAQQKLREELSKHG
jgi:hypothetical protein